MLHKISAVVIDADAALRADIVKSLKCMDRIKVAGEAGTLQKGRELVERLRPTLVVLDMDSERGKAAETLEGLCRSFPGTYVFAASSDSTSENILRAIRCGATDFLVRPVSPHDLQACTRKVWWMLEQRPAGRRGEEGRVITCFPPKGGVGNTTVAANLAVSLQAQTERAVALVDLDLYGADAGTFLNIKAPYTLHDAAMSAERLDPAFLHGILVRHPSGVHVLAGPHDIEETEAVTPAQARKVIELLKGMFAYVVVDAGTGYGDINLEAFDLSDLVIVVMVLSLPSINNASKALNVLSRLGHAKGKVRLLINRLDKKGDITPEDAEKTLGWGGSWRIPNDYAAALAAINRGAPLQTTAPMAEITRSFEGLAGRVSGLFGQAAAGTGGAAAFTKHRRA